MKQNRSSAGETLTETLAAVLVAAVAIVMLTTAVVGAAHLNAQARDSYAELWGDSSDSSQEGELASAELNGRYVGDSSAINGTDITVSRRDASDPAGTKDSSQTYNGRDLSISGGKDVISWRLKNGRASAQ